MNFRGGLAGWQRSQLCWSRARLFEDRLKASHVSQPCRGKSGHVYFVSTPTPLPSTPHGFSSPSKTICQPLMSVCGNPLNVFVTNWEKGTVKTEYPLVTVVGNYWSKWHLEINTTGQRQAVQINEVPSRCVPPVMDGTLYPAWYQLPRQSDESQQNNHLLIGIRDDAQW